MCTHSENIRKSSRRVSAHYGLRDHPYRYPCCRRYFTRQGKISAAAIIAVIRSTASLSAITLLRRPIVVIYTGIV